MPTRRHQFQPPVSAPITASAALRNRSARCLRTEYCRRRAAWRAAKRTPLSPINRFERAATRSRPRTTASRRCFRRITTRCCRSDSRIHRLKPVIRAASPRTSDSDLCRFAEAQRVRGAHGAARYLRRFGSSCSRPQYCDPLRDLLSPVAREWPMSEEHDRTRRHISIECDKQSSSARRGLRNVHIFAHRPCSHTRSNLRAEDSTGWRPE